MLHLFHVLSSRRVTCLSSHTDRRAFGCLIAHAETARARSAALVVCLVAARGATYRIVPRHSGSANVETARSSCQACRRAPSGDRGCAGAVLDLLACRRPSTGSSISASCCRHSSHARRTGLRRIDPCGSRRPCRRCRPRAGHRHLRPRARHRPTLAAPRQAGRRAAARGRSPASLARAVADGCCRAPSASRFSRPPRSSSSRSSAVLAARPRRDGGVSLVSCVEVALWERRTDTHLFADADVHTRRYVTPPSVA